MIDVATKPDISDVSQQQWPARELGNFTGQRDSYFQVVFKQSVLDKIHLHGQGSAEIEICGVLVGNVYQDSRGPYLLIEHCVAGSGAASKSTAVTFTAETWQHIHETMDRDHPDRKITGWYHTHPTFGIFLSDMDIFICDGFFNLPWQCAFVYDPHSGEEGNFVWRGGRPQREAWLIENDVTPIAAKIPLISKAEATGEKAFPAVPVRLRDTAAEQIIELQYRVLRLERRQQLLMIALVFLAVFVAVWAVVPNAPGLQRPVIQKPTTRLVPTPVRIVTQ